MKASTFSEPQIAFVLKQTEDDTPIGEVCRKGEFQTRPLTIGARKYASLMPSGDEATSPTRGRECQAEADRRRPVVGQGHASERPIKKARSLPASASLSTRSGGLEGLDSARMLGVEDRAVALCLQVQPRRAGRTEAEKQGRLPNTGALRLPPRARAAQA